MRYLQMAYTEFTPQEISKPGSDGITSGARSSLSNDAISDMAIITSFNKSDSSSDKDLLPQIDLFDSTAALDSKPLDGNLTLPPNDDWTDPTKDSASLSDDGIMTVAYGPRPLTGELTFPTGDDSWTDPTQDS